MGIKDELETTKVLNFFEQDDKKLHNSTSNEYTDPTDNNEWGMRMGDEIKEEIEEEEERWEGEVRLKRYCRRESELLLLFELTVEEDSRFATIDNDFHGLPPEPEEELKSNSKSSQDPNTLGIEITNNGDTTTEGDEIVMFWETL